MRISIDMSKMNAKVDRAQYWLDSQIMTDMLPKMPFRTGMLRNLTQAASQSIAGSGVVVAAAPPTGRFLYMGKVMVDAETGSPWARRGAKKVVTERDLVYSNPEAQAFWFDAAKAEHLKQWQAGVKKIIGE